LRLDDADVAQQFERLLVLSDDRHWDCLLSRRKSYRCARAAPDAHCTYPEMKRAAE
jgi:hypothetical protein